MTAFITLAAAAAQHLPYRETGTIWPMLLKALLISVVLLALVLGLLLLARRYGWLAGSVSTLSRPELEIVTSRRLTPYTTVVVVRHAETDYVIAESSRQISIVPVSATDAAAKGQTR